MPEELDPNWEYWEPDPEVAEVMSGAVVLGYVTEGFRIGHPDRPILKLGPLKKRPTPDAGDRPGAQYRVRCLGCGDRYWSVSMEPAYCCAPCREDPSPFRCEQCHLPYWPEVPGGKFCSRACRYAHFSSTWHETHTANGAPRKLPDKQCPTCKRTFRPGRAEKIYCSNACYIRPGTKRTLDDRACDFCKRLFRPSHKTRRYCSMACTNDAQRQLHKEAPVSLDDAKLMIQRGVPFGDVYPRLKTELDRADLKEWFAHNRDLPNLEARTAPIDHVPGFPAASTNGAVTVARAMGYTGNACPRCESVRMVRAGACERCEDCGDTTSCG